jgi:DNA gyrase subunit A
MYYDQDDIQQFKAAQKAGDLRGARILTVMYRFMSEPFTPGSEMKTPDEARGKVDEIVAKGADFVEHLFIASTHAFLMIFTDDGTVYKIKVHEVPDAAASARGKAIVNLISMPSDRKLAGVVPVRDFEEGRYVLMVTRKGVIKKTSLADFKNIRSNGINAINIDEGDQLLDVVLTDGTKRIFIATRNGMAIRFDEKNVRPMGRATRGVRGVDLRGDDFPRLLEREDVLVGLGVERRPV